MWLWPGALQRIVEREVDEIEAFEVTYRKERPTSVAGLVTTASIRR
jgi:hypothetical protein